MARFERFEDIEAWQKARTLSSMVYQVTNDGLFARDFGLRDQTRRSAVSIMSNIAEGFERNSNRVFRRFLLIAKGSAGELRSQLYIAGDANLISADQFADLHGRATEISRMLQSLANYLNSTD